MAKAITHINSRLTTVDEQIEQAKEEILEAAAKNKESLLLLLEVVNDLKQAGILEILHGFLGNLHQIGAIGMTQLNKSGAQNLIKNGLGAVQFLAKLEPDQLGMLLGALGAGADNALPKSGKADKVGLFAMMRAMRGPDMQAAFGFLLNFLRGIGRYLQKSPS